MTKKLKPRDVLTNLLNDIPLSCCDEFAGDSEMFVADLDTKRLARLALKQLAAAGFRITGHGGQR